MKGKDEIKDLFSDKLGGYEAKVNPELWANISANIGTTATATTTGLTVLSKTIIGLGLVAATITGVVLLTNERPNNDNKEVKPALSEVETEVTAPKVVESNPAEIEFVSESSSTAEVDSEGAGSTQEEATNISVEEENQTRAFEVPLNEQGGRVANEDNPTIEVEEQNSSVEEETAVKEEAEEEDNVSLEENEVTLEEKQEETKETVLKLSNIITPNNDMNNDFLFVESSGLTDFNVVVLNAQNSVVYQSNDPAFRWNGTRMDGSPVDSGNYVYFITARDANGKTVNQHSSLTIVR